MKPRRDLPVSFLYEPSSPPTIAPGMTIADYRRQRDTVASVGGGRGGGDQRRGRFRCDYVYTEWRAR